MERTETGFTILDAGAKLKASHGPLGARPAQSVVEKRSEVNCSNIGGAGNNDARQTSPSLYMANGEKVTCARTSEVEEAPRARPRDGTGSSVIFRVAARSVINNNCSRRRIVSAKVERF